MTGAEKIVNAMKQVNKSNKSTPSEIVSATVIGVNPLIFQLENRLQIDNKFYELSNLTDWSKVQIGQVFRALSFNEGQKYYILEEYPLKASTNSAKMDERISTNRTDINTLDRTKQNLLTAGDNITIDETGKIDVNMQNFNKYSTTEETIIGYWDDKPIYRKVITGYIGNNTTYQFPLNIDNIEYKWLNGSSFLLTPNGISKPLNVFESGSNYYIRTELTNTTINVMHSDTQYYSGTMYAIIEYTKTTD